MRRSLGQRELPNSALRYVLESLIPYTDANLKLSFSPNHFFNDLENISRQKEWLKHRGKARQAYSRQSLRNQFYAARKKGFMVIDEQGLPRLTEKGQHAVRPYKPQKLGSSAYLMIAFDIPETQRQKRDHVRLLLKELKFVKIQQSMWISEYDHREYIKAEIRSLKLEDRVHVYECIRLV